MSRKCKRCGSCCLQIGDIINISEDDIKRWVKEGRSDILQFCAGWTKDCFKLMVWREKELIRYLNESINMEMWFNPKSGNEISLCPFLRKQYGKNQFKCTIHNTKPKICREYICDPKNMLRIIKKPFRENLLEYKKMRKSRNV